MSTRERSFHTHNVTNTHVVNKGEKLSTRGRSLHSVHSFERDCTCSGGVALELLLIARCVEPLPLLEGLAVFWLFELC
jgi:hypothetical protein